MPTNTSAQPLLLPPSNSIHLPASPPHPAASTSLDSVKQVAPPTTEADDPKSLLHTVAHILPPHAKTIRRTAPDEMKDESPEEKRKRQFNYMKSDVLKKQKMHLLAGAHFAARANFVFVISATMTLIQAVLAILAQANHDSERARSAFDISIALLAPISFFWQSCVQHWDYSGKATLHKSASSALEEIYYVALLRAENDAAWSRDIEEGGGNANDDEDDDHHISKEPEVPMQIACAFRSLDTRVGVCKEEIVSRSDKSSEDACRVRWEIVIPELYQTLATTITSQPGWPFFLPNPEKVVDKAIRKFQNFDANLLESLLERSRKIDGIMKPLSLPQGSSLEE